MFSKEVVRKFLYFDVETVCQFPNYEALSRENPRLAKLWERRSKYYKGAYMDLKESSVSEIYLQKGALEPEFSKVVCVSFGTFTDNGEKKFISFSGEDEKEILSKTNKIFTNALIKGWKLCGHNIKGFDVPCLGKRMVYNSMNPASNLQIWDKKPWDIPFIDTSEIYAFGSWTQQKYLSLDLLSCSFNIESPKLDMDGAMVHQIYWEDLDFERIKRYCETDVNTVMEILEKSCFD